MDNKRSDPLITIKQLIQERYVNAKAIFWAGSVAQNKGTHASDLDLVIVFDSIPHAYREAFVYNNWPVDAFVNDAASLRYFFEKSRVETGISGLIDMIMHGHEVTAPNVCSATIKALAHDFLKQGPIAWDKKKIDTERFFITDVLYDIRFPASYDEQIASAGWLFEALAQFYFRAQNKWSASGKSIIRYLKRDNPKLAKEYSRCFKTLFLKKDCSELKCLVQKILMPYGGLLWDGFKSNEAK